jgi:lysophospholipase L1-like esterase
MITVGLVSMQTMAIAEELVWHDASVLGVEGQGWSEGLQRTYDRLPAKAEKTVPGSVWGFSRESAGMSVGFITDATSIHIRYALKSEKLAHGWTSSSNLSISGFDMYAQVLDTKTGEAVWRWVVASPPKSQSDTVCLVQGIATGKRKYVIYFPAYNGVETLEVGIPSTATLENVPLRKDKPIVFYGTSIMQGATPSRAGLSITAQLGRRLSIPTINLGFCGCGRMDMPVVELLAELSPAIYVIDCLPNMNADQVKERTAALVHRLREAHADTPILLVEDHFPPSPSLFPEVAKKTREKNKTLRVEYDQLIEGGVKNLYYLKGDDLIGHDSEGTVDGIHPNDLGTAHYVAEYEQILSAILNRD